jgi:hypothetical protein
MEVTGQLHVPAALHPTKGLLLCIEWQTGRAAQSVWTVWSRHWVAGWPGRTVCLNGLKQTLSGRLAGPHSLSERFEADIEWQAGRAAQSVWTVWSRHWVAGWPGRTVCLNGLKQTLFVSPGNQTMIPWSSGPYLNIILTTEKSDLKQMLKEDIPAYFKLLSRHVPGRSE